MTIPSNPRFKGNSAVSAPSQNPPKIASCLDQIAPLHWQEWLDSGIDPELIRANLRSLDGSSTYDYLCYAPGLDRTQGGRLASHLLRRYAHTEAGGWWCQGLDPLNNWAPMDWGCFKADTPRRDTKREKTIKYEHPLKTPTRAFFLADPQQPTFWPDHAATTSQPIILVEGAKKAAALLSQGYAAIALPGVFNGRRVMRDGSGKVYSESLIPELTHFAQAGRPVYFCFDSDPKASTRYQVNLAIATTARLLQAAGCDVYVIDLAGPEKGVDDFLVAHGSAAFQTRYAAALPLAMWQWQCRQQAELTTIPTQIVHQAEFQPTDLPTSGILVLSSAKGTGKTKAIVNLVQDAPRVIALGHRIALMRNLCDRMGLDYRNDLDEFQGQAINANGVAHRVGLCVDSLGKINPEDFVGAIVVVDEYMQVLYHMLLSDTCNQNGKRPALLARLTQIIRNASLVILADADAADVGIDYFRTLRGDHQPVHLIRNDFQPKGFPVRCLNSAKDNLIVAEIMEDIVAGRKIFIATDSLDSSEALKQLIDALKSSPNGLIINSKTSSQPAQKAFITNPNATVQQYNWVLATPSLSTGVSIEVAHFDKVYGLFYGVASDADAAQAINRVRANIPRTIWTVKRGKNFSRLSQSTQPRTIAQVLKYKTDLTAQLIRASLACPDMLLPELFDAVWQQNPHITLFTQLVARTNQSLWTIRDSLLARLHYEGNQITIVESQSSDDSPMKTARQQVQQAHLAAVAQATILTPPELEKLTSQEGLSPTDQLNIEKTQAASFLVVEAVTIEQVQFYIKYHKAILQFETLMHGRDLAISRDLDELTRQIQWGYGFLPADMQFNELKRFVRDQLGLMAYLDPEITWSNDDLQALGDRVRYHRDQVKLILGVTIPLDQKFANNGWIFQLLCRQLGLQVKSYRRGPRGGQQRYYQLERDHYLEVLAVADRRQQQRLMALEPLQSLNSTQTATSVVTPPGLNQTSGVDYTIPPPPQAVTSVVTPLGLNQISEGDYTMLPPRSPMPDHEIAAQIESSPKLPNRFVGQKVFETISDRVQRQVDLVIGGLRSAATTIGHGFTSQSD